MKKIFMFLLVCSVFSTSAAEPSSHPIENRFLFVVETSSLMNRSANAAQETIRNLVTSGARGRMRSGDTFGLWTFNDRLNPEFPMQQWTPDEGKKLAEAAVDYLNRQRYEKKGRLQTTVLPPLFSVINSSRAVTVILISSGTEPIRGTPFDKEINSLYSIYERELRDAKIPFVTSLVGRNGKVVAFAVNSTLGPIEIPTAPLPEIPIVQIKTNAPTLINTSTPTNPAVPPRRFAKSNIIIGKVVTTNVPPITTSPITVTNASSSSSQTTNAAISPSLDATLSNVVPSAVLQTKTNFISGASSTNLVESAPSTNAPSLVANQSTNSPTTSTALSVIAPAPLQPVPNPEPEQTASAKSQIQEVASSPKIFPSSHVTQELSHAPSLAEAPMASLQPGRYKKFIFVGVLLLLGAGSLVFLLIRNSRSKSGPSLISRSMDQDPK